VNLFSTVLCFTGTVTFLQTGGHKALRRIVNDDDDDLYDAKCCEALEEEALLLLQEPWHSNWRQVLFGFILLALSLSVRRPALCVRAAKIRCTHTT